MRLAQVDTAQGCTLMFKHDDCGTCGYEVRFLFHRSIAISVHEFLLETGNFGNMYLSNSSSLLGNWILCGILLSYFLQPLKMGAFMMESESCAVTEGHVCVADREYFKGEHIQIDPLFAQGAQDTDSDSQEED